MLDEGYKNPSPVKVGNKLVGDGHPLFFIAEIGINHNGDMNLCKKLIDVAVEKGCDAVKFQKRNPEMSIPLSQRNKLRETPWGEINYLEHKKRLEFGEEEYREIDRYCKEKGILWFASVWDPPSVDFLEKFDVPFYKIPSAALTYKEVLERVKETGKPVILSTGMSTMEQISTAVKILGEDNLIILHCTSTYPAEDEELDLNVIKTLRKNFNCPIGYSGHDPGIWAPIAATALGACVIEKHITLGRYMYGTDQAASLEPTNLDQVCRTTKRISSMLGSYEKRVHESEKPLREKLKIAYDF